MVTSAKTQRVESDCDLFCVDHVMDPYPTLDQLRDSSAAVYMSHHGYWLLTRYDDVKAATKDWRAYTSAQGVALMPAFNESVRGTVLGTDPPEHDALRAVLADKVTPRALRDVHNQIAATAERIVTDVVRRGSFDGVVDLARVFPVTVVADLFGLPVEGRERLYPGADATFTAFGPQTPALAERQPDIESYMQYLFKVVSEEQLAPGSWGAEVQNAVKDGRLTMMAGVSTVGSYLLAGIDTSVNSIGAMLRLFAERSDVWDAVREDPRLARAAFEEMLRLETPIQGFFRVATRDTAVDDVTIPAGDQIMLHWGAANRDPRHYADPHAFDLHRNAMDHLGFGHGPHACIGQGLARMEMASLVEVLITQVRRFELTGEVVRRYHPIARSLDSVPLRVEAVS
ncbi:cytochrome P450 [Mycolicibacterium nivoides]|uniref:cytochrome P450 n=1 Tax=Mycolicibacterium nivoides TaxID=2487344 RepID=UPI003C2D7E7D